MIEKLQSILGKVQADYADIRYEKRSDIRIVFSGNDLTRVESSSTDGYVLRILAGGGMAASSFTAESDCEQAIQQAYTSALSMGRGRGKPVELAPFAGIKDSFMPELDEDPLSVSIEEKIELLRGYIQIPLQYEQIVNPMLGYSDVIRDKWFVSTEGAAINERLVTSLLQGDIKSKRGNLIQNVRVSAGGSDGFYNIRNQESNFEQRCKIAIDLLDAEPVKGGKYNCVLNPMMTGVFTHEAFGHFSEADLVEALPMMRSRMKIGEQLGSEMVNIIDDATQSHQLGFYKYDDEGVPVRRVELMKNGVLTGRLHSRRTAAEFGEPLSGHNIAEDYRYAPIIRMGNIYIAAGQDSLESLLNRLGDGIYLLDPKGGQTAGENFTFGAQYGYEVKNGKLGRMLRDINVSGNLYKTLKNIAGIGDTVELSKVGGCGKGQTNIRSCLGGPHTLIKELMIGGN